MIFHVFYVSPMFFNGCGCCLNASISNPVNKHIENKSDGSPVMYDMGGNEGASE